MAPKVDYLPLRAGQEPPAALLTVGFGAAAPAASPQATPLQVRVPLEPLLGSGLTEVWRARGLVRGGESGAVRFRHDDHWLAGVVEVHEERYGGIIPATAFAYRTLAAFQASSGFPYLLRTWNHLDAINEGAGDAERYRGFCTGRVSGLGSLAQHPAATVIGTRGSDRVLQVYWLAGRVPGTALENPRQVPASRYPRSYGETSPTFSRALSPEPGVLMVSGTASIVGHETRHTGSVGAQLDEIVANLESLLAHARLAAPGLPPSFDRDTRIKVYLRRAQHLAGIEGALRRLLPADLPLLVLQGDVCRADLLVEIEAVHFSSGG